MHEPPSNPLNLLGIGGAHIDRRGQVAGIYVPGASNPGTMREDVGGVVFNALRNASQRGVRAALISLRGGDGGGERIARTIAEAGIEDLSAVFLDRASSSYTALIDRDGELIAGFADMSLYDLFSRQLRRAACRKAIAAADAILIDANMPADALELAARHAGDTHLFGIGISPAKIVRMTGILESISCLFMNAREAATLAGEGVDITADAVVRALRARGLARGVITSGNRPVVLFDDRTILAIQPPAPRHIVDVTGAGDAVAGATIAALMQGADFSDAVRDGLAAALLALACRDAVPDLAPRAFAEALALVPEPVELA